MAKKAQPVSEPGRSGDGESHPSVASGDQDPVLSATPSGDGLMSCHSVLPRQHVTWNAVSLSLCLWAGLAAAGEPHATATHPGSDEPDLWSLAVQHAGTLRLSTLFTARDVQRHLSDSAGMEKAIAWCRRTGITHVYLETFRDGYTAERAALLAAKQGFRQPGFLVSGCVTTTGIGRKSVNGWMFPCFTEQAGLDKLKRIFEYTAELFDEIMIDDFLATRCECEDCVRARGDRSWDRFRCDLMVDVSRQRILEPARRVNPDVSLIIKYPQWYDEFHEKGYDVLRQTQMFDKIWVGTETRDPDNEKWGRKSQYEAYFIMRWLGTLGGDKCGGGWFDPYGTSPAVYLEQGRQTVLAGAQEVLLFCYGSLQSPDGQANVQAFRRELPQLFELAALLRGKMPQGIAAPKPPNSHAAGDRYIYDYVGLLGLPLVPAVEIRTDVAAMFLPLQASADAGLTSKVATMIAKHKPLLLTRQLAVKLAESVDLAVPEVSILDVPDDPWKLMDAPAEVLQRIRDCMTVPFGIRIRCPTRVAVYLFEGKITVVESFNDHPAEIDLTAAGMKAARLELSIPPQSAEIAVRSGGIRLLLAPRSLAVVNWAD